MFKCTLLFMVFKERCQIEWNSVMIYLQGYVMLQKTHICNAVIAFRRFVFIQLCLGPLLFFYISEITVKDLNLL